MSDPKVSIQSDIGVVIKSIEEIDPGYEWKVYVENPGSLERNLENWFTFTKRSLGGNSSMSYYDSGFTYTIDW
jgi:hypothetical protein